MDLDKLNTLSQREIEILKLVSAMKTSSEIGNQLRITVKTVENHRGNIAKKLGLKGNNSVLRYAVKYRNEIKNFTNETK